MFNYFKKKTKPNTQNNQKEQISAQTTHGNFQIVQQLLRAIQESNFQMVELLLNRYAQEIRAFSIDPSILDQIACTAVDKGHFETVELVFNYLGQEISALYKGVALTYIIGNNDKIAELLINRYSQEISVDRKELALHLAVYKECDNLIEPLLNSVNKSEAFQIAYEKGHHKVVELLLTRFSQEISSADKIMVLAQIVKNCHLEMLNCLLKIQEVKDEFINVPQQINGLVKSLREIKFPGLVLEKAITLGYDQLIELLLSCFEKNKLMLDASFHGSKQAIMLLFNRYSHEINDATQCQVFQNACHYKVANQDRFEITKQLLDDCGNKINGSIKGWVLIQAIKEGNFHTVELLLTHAQGVSAIPANRRRLDEIASEAVDKGHFETVELVFNYLGQEISALYKGVALTYTIGNNDKIAELLINRYSQEISIEHKETALHHAVYRGHNNLIEPLLDCLNKSEAFQIAYEKGHHKVVELLLTRFSQEISSANKKRVLEIVLKNKTLNSKIVQLLLIDFCEGKNLSEKHEILQDAIKNHYFEVVNYLLEIKKVMDYFTQKPEWIHNLLTMFSLNALSSQQVEYLEKLLQNIEIRSDLIENEAKFPSLKKFKDDAQAKAGRRFKSSRAIPSKNDITEEVPLKPAESSEQQKDDSSSDDEFKPARKGAKR